MSDPLFYVYYTLKFYPLPLLGSLAGAAVLGMFLRSARPFKVSALLLAFLLAGWTAFQIVIKLSG